MLLCFSTTAVIVCILLKNTAFADYSGRCFYDLSVSNDGPVTLDVPVAISAQLSCAQENITFRYMFEDDTNRQIGIAGYDMAKASFIFNAEPGQHTIKVHVWLENLEIATGDTLVEVHEYIPGNLDFSGTVEDKDGHKYIGTGWDTNITLEIHYPRHVLQDAEFSYSWTVGEDRFSTDRSYMAYRFREPGPKWIRVAVVGHVPAYDGTNRYRFKWGYFDKEVTVKDPFFGINISGNTYLEHGQLLDLDISCNGSGPVDYCWKLLPISENHTNLSCTDAVTSTQCSIPILYYFRDSGDFQLSIYVSNLVTSFQRNIQVHIYDVSLRQQLSTVIMPVVCTVMVVIIIVVGVIIHMRRNSGYNIETADFDFMRAEEPSTVAAETSWEHMWRSLVHLLQPPCLCHSMDRESSNVHYGTILKESTECQ